MCAITAYSAYLPYCLYIYCAELINPGHPVNSLVQQRPGSPCSVLDTPYQQCAASEDIATDQLPRHGALLGSLMALFSSGWITSGSANFSSYSKSIQRQTLACSITNAPSSLYWRSIRAHGKQVILCSFYICCFCDIFLDLSLGRSVSICYPLRAPRTITSLVCNSSVLLTGTPSSCSSGRDRNSTIHHATRIG